MDAIGVCGGACQSDDDGDGICDNEDDCVGTLDVCGVCNGDNTGCTGCMIDFACNFDPDAVINDNSLCEYESCQGCMDLMACNFDPFATIDDGTNCSYIVSGDCDCAGNQLDALGVCGGDCAEDADVDGICDDVDDCIGELDACDVCNGPGDIYECGCSDIAEGDCDCDGNQLDALGVCGGACAFDEDGNGVCDDAEIGGCTDAEACNFDPVATLNDGSCDYCSCVEEDSFYPLEVIATPAVAADGMVYRFYVQMQNPLDRFSGVFGDDDGHMAVNAPSGVFNSIYNPGWSAAGINSLTLSNFPELADDTYATIGLEGSASGISGAADPSLVEDEEQRISPFFQMEGATALLSNTPVGSAWYVLNSASNGLPDASGRVLIMQVTTSGSVSGTLNYQLFPSGVQEDYVQISVDFDGPGVFGSQAELTGCGCTDPEAFNYDAIAEYDNGSCIDVVVGCLESEACNYDMDANTSDGSCLYDDALGVCGGDCDSDDDGNGICDNEEVGGCTDSTNPAFDPNAIFDDGSCLVGGCLIEEACNYDASIGYQLPGACEFESCAGCTDDMACNYDMDATIDDDSCEFPDEFVDCEGNCINDADGDGVCDELEVLGCTEEGNPGYDPSATEDDGSCLVAGCLLPFACNYNADADYITVDLCDFTSCLGCIDEEACNYEPEASLGATSLCEYPATLFLDCDGVCVNDDDGDGVCDEQEIPGCTDEAAVNFNPFATDDNGSCLVLQGGCVLPFACNFDPEADFYLPGSCDFSCLFGSGESDCNNEMACNYGATDEPCMFFDASGNTCVPGGCNIAQACNYDENAVYNDGSCDYSSCQVFGCNVETACNYESDATVNNGTCDFSTCFNVDVDGCTNPLACNFEEGATVNDGTCDFASCVDLGCTDATACNYNADASINDGSCVTAVAGFDCEGNCVADADADGVCDMDEVDGCTDMGANNYDDSATDNDGTCTYDADGCTDAYACNFNYQASTDNGSCVFDCYGCMNENACNFNMEATLHDSDACAYLFATTVEGETEVVVEEPVEYLAALHMGSEYIWSVEGGVLVSGQGTHAVTVVWLLEQGSLSVHEVNAAGCEGDVVTLDIQGSVSSVGEETEAFTAFPNPANDVVVVTTSGFEAHAFQVLDATGRVVLSQRLVSGRNTINVANLANGSYHMVLDQERGRQVKPLVIAH